MFANPFTWLGLVILIVIAACYVLVHFLGKKLSFGMWMLGALVVGLVVGAILQLLFGSASAHMNFAFEIANIIKTAYTNLNKNPHVPTRCHTRSQAPASNREESREAPEQLA